MNRLIIILFCFLCFSNTKASPQEPDFLIIGQDTIEIYFLPLNKLDSTKLKEFQHNLISYKEDLYSSSNLWREYQGLWRLEDNKLYLVGLKNNPNSEKILKATFGTEYQKGKVPAKWFSSRVAVVKGKVLRWDELFSRSYFKEEILDFKKGQLVNRKFVDNYIKVDNGIPRVTKEQAEETIINRIKQINRPKTIFQ